ncbi:immunoglobulin domain-containing protein, partial [Moheibacter sediminis]
MRKHLFYLLLLGVVFTNAQVLPQVEWAKNLGSTGGDEGWGIANTLDGGYIAIGNTYMVDGDVTANYGNYDYWVAKLDSSGNIEWTKNYGGTNSDQARKVVPTPDGGYILAGMTDSNNIDVSGTHGEYWYEGEWYGDYQDDYWIVKIDSAGNIEWQKTLGGNHRELLNDIKVTANGGYIISGTSNSNSGDVTDSHQSDGGYDMDAWVVNLDSQGNIVWQKAFGGYDGSSRFESIEQTSDGGYIAGGSTSAIGGDAPPLKGIADLWVVKMGQTGNIEWSKTFGGSRGQVAHSVKQLPNNGYIVSGVSSSADGDVSNGVDNLNTRWVIKLDDDGAIEWERSYHGMWGAVTLEITSDGNFVLGDMIQQDANLMKIDVASGEIIWSKSFGGSGRDMIYGMVLTPDGGFVTVGGSNSNDGDIPGNHGDYDILVAKLSPDCLVPELTIDTTHTICVGEELTLTADAEAELISWYDAAEAETPIFTGTEFELPELTETTSYWVEAANGVCKTGRTEIIITVNPLPVLEAETTYAICSGNEASLYASSPSNVIFWYANEDDTEYLYHGNLFVTEVLTENTTY